MREVAKLYGDLSVLRQEGACVTSYDLVPYGGEGANEVRSVCGSVTDRSSLEAAMQGEDETVQVLEALIYELKVICFCTGARTALDLRGVRLLEA